MQEAELKQIETILNYEHAPRGDLTVDFKTALYVISCLYQIDLSSISNLGVCAKLLADIGYKKELSGLGLEQYQRTLDELVDEKALVRLGDFNCCAAPEQLHRFSSTVYAKEKPGTLGGREKFFVYCVCDNAGVEYLLKSLRVILPGDEVECLSVEGKEYAYECALLKKRLCVLGRIMLLNSRSRRRAAALMPDEPNLGSQTFEFENSADLDGAEPGDVVIAEITGRSGTKCLVKTREIVRDLGSLNNIIVMAVLRHDIPSSWPAPVLKMLPRIPDHVTPENLKGREDLRELPLVTIDGEDARDFDDAVYCCRSGQGWKLYVAIADVSFYVRSGTLIDKEAMLRGNSCYFPNYVIPMLPEKLSNGICSLNPDVDRLCMVCEMDINRQAETEHFRFYPAVMRSHARMTYTEVWRMLTKGDISVPEHSGLIHDIKELYELFKAFRKARRRRGGISAEKEELRFIFNEELEIAGIEPVKRNDAHMIIEECMIAANVAAATFVADNKAQTLFRVHPRPGEKKLEALLVQLDRFGLSLTGGDTPSSVDYAKLCESVAGRPDAAVINELILRSMSKAEYTPENIGHFGLALEKYAHFTSPIRRYADLQLHRVIKYLLEKQDRARYGKLGGRSYTKAELVALGQSCTACEIKATEAEYDVNFELACTYLKNFLGEIVDGTVTACTKFGVFVHLDKFGVDGMIYVGSFQSYMNFDERAHTLSGSNGDVYVPGRKVKVKINDLDPLNHKIDLLPAAGGVSGRYQDIRNFLLRKGASGGKKKHCAEGGAEAKADDKEITFSKIADISRAREAQPEDRVLRQKKSSEWGDEILNTLHYANPLMMPSGGSDSWDAQDGGRTAGKKGKKNSKRSDRDKD